MPIYPAELTDINTCCQMDLSYSTDYVWQMQAQQNGRAIDIRFDTVRLPRPMRVSYPRPLDELVEHWQQDMCFLVARTPNEEPAGFLDGRADPWQSLLWIANLGVAKNYRRQGYGTRLLQAAVRWAEEQNLRRLMLEIQTKNYPAISFAQKHGFQFCGYNERYFPNGDIALFFSRST